METLQANVLCTSAMLDTHVSAIAQQTCFCLFVNWSLLGMRKYASRISAIS
jgi:hypothetical protein